MNRIINEEEIYYEIAEEKLFTARQAEQLYENEWIKKINYEIENASRQHDKQIVVSKVPNWLQEKLNLNGFKVETIIVNGYYKSKISWY